MDPNFTSCLAKQEKLLSQFSALKDQEARYFYLIEIGRSITQCEKKEIALPANLVRGCQSEVFLTAHEEEGKIFFSVYTEALISAGLVALLLLIYNGENAEIILKCPPSCLEKLGIQSSLTPARSNGLASIYLRMKQEALHLLLNRSIF